LQSEIRKRNIALRVYIKEILNAKIVEDGQQKLVLVPSEHPLIRVSVMGVVTNIYFSQKTPDSTNELFAFIILEDGTGIIRCKAWGPETALFESLQKGDLVHIIGKVKIYNEEVYIVPEIVKRIENPNFLLLHEAQVLKRKIREQELSKPKVMAKIMDFIRRNNRGTGVPLELIQKSFNAIPENLLREALLELLNNGDIYEYMKNVYKPVEG